MEQFRLRARAQVARILGWIALLACAGSSLPWVTAYFGEKGIGRTFAIGFYLAMAAPLLAFVAVLCNLRALKPRSVAPTIALVLGLIVAAIYVFMVVQLAGLGRMH